MDNKKYKYNPFFLKIANEVHDIFKQDKILKEKEYVINGNFALNLYSFTKMIKTTITIDVSKNKKKQTVSRALSRWGLIEDKHFVILKERKQQTLNQSNNYNKEDKFGNILKANVVSVEKLFIELDNFVVESEQKEFAIEKMKKVIDINNFFKLLKNYRERKMLISKAAREFEKELVQDKHNKKFIKSKVENFKDLDTRLEELQQDLKGLNIIQMGGIAAKEYTLDERMTMDIDGFTNEKNKNLIISTLKKKYDVIENKPDKNYKEVSTLTVSKKGKNQYGTIDIDLDHSFKKEGIEKLFGLDAVEKTENGFFVKPELLIILKIKILLDSISDEKSLSYHSRLERDYIDILNVYKCKEIDLIFLKKLFAEVLKITNWHEDFDFSKKEIFFKIIEQSDRFRKNYKEKIKFHKIKYLPLEPDDVVIKKIIQTLEKPRVKNKNISQPNKTNQNSRHF